MELRKISIVLLFAVVACSPPEKAQPVTSKKPSENVQPITSKERLEMGKNYLEKPVTLDRLRIADVNLNLIEKTAPEYKEARILLKKTEIPKKKTLDLSSGEVRRRPGARDAQARS